jgi:hypothetical protein
MGRNGTCLVLHLLTPSRAIPSLLGSCYFRIEEMHTFFPE